MSTKITSQVPPPIDRSILGGSYPPRNVRKIQISYIKDLDTSIQGRPGWYKVARLIPPGPTYSRDWPGVDFTVAGFRGGTITVHLR